MKKPWRKGRDPKPLIHWIPDIVSQKRKRQDGDGEELWHSKQRTRPVQIEQREGQSQSHLLGPKTPNANQTRVSPTPSEIPFNNSTISDDPLPELTYSDSMSPPDIDEFRSIDDFHYDEDASQTQLFDGLKPLGDVSTIEFDKYKAQSPNDEAFFSQYLRSPTRSCSDAGGVGSNSDDTNTPAHTIDPKDVCLLTQEDPSLEEMIDDNPVKSKDDSIETKPTRIILRIRQP